MIPRLSKITAIPLLAGIKAIHKFAPQSRKILTYDNCAKPLMIANSAITAGTSFVLPPLVFSSSMAIATPLNSLLPLWRAPSINFGIFCGSLFQNPAWVSNNIFSAHKEIKQPWVMQIFQEAQPVNVKERQTSDGEYTVIRKSRAIR